MFILGEPTVIEQLEARHPQFASQVDDIRNRLNEFNPGERRKNAIDAARTAVAPFTIAESTGAAREPTQPTDPFQLTLPLTAISQRNRHGTTPAGVLSAIDRSNRIRWPRLATPPCSRRLASS